MEWFSDKPRFGDAIRTKISFYHHFALYVDDNTVVQFGLPDNSGRKIDEIDVCITDIEGFSQGRAVERAEFSAHEQKEMKTAEEAVECALSRIGETGYDFFMNNCADFVNSCIFKEGSELDVMEIRKGHKS